MTSHVLDPSGGPGGGRPPGLSPKSLNIVLLFHFISMPRLLHVFCVFVYYVFALGCCAVKCFRWCWLYWDAVALFLFCVIRSIRGIWACQSWLFYSSLIEFGIWCYLFSCVGDFYLCFNVRLWCFVIMFVWKAMLWFVGAINCNCKCDVSSEFEVSGWTDSLERLRRLEHWLVTCWFVLCFRALIVSDIRVHVLNLNVFQIGMLGF